MNHVLTSRAGSAPTSRRSLLKTTGALLASVTAAKTLSAARESNTRILYVGGYGQGIYRCVLDYPSGKLTQLGLTPAASPSFLCLNSDRSVLYAINEINPGTATAYQVNPATGDLALINAVPCASTNVVSTAANGPAHVSIHSSGKFLLTSQYGGASIGVLPINSDGSLGAPVDTILHTGNLGPGQTQAHPHMTLSDPSGKYVISHDLGQDRTYIYTLDVSTGKLSPGPTPWVNSQPGSGPRHVAFSTDGIYLYSICELGGIINVYYWDSSAGNLILQRTVSTLPEGYAGRVQCCEVQVSADGGTVYGANRGFDSIAAFSVRESGPTLYQAKPRLTWTQGQTPRHFTLDPTGRLLLSGNQDSNNIVIFAVDLNGDLTPTGQFFANTKPACILFLQ